jgi:hypothetical protein
VLPAAGVSFVYTVQVGHGPGPSADVTCRGHCYVILQRLVMSLSHMSLSFFQRVMSW